MSLISVCRLCFSMTNGLYIDIFSDVGVELKINEIIAEHFKYHVSQADLLSNVICHACWSTTEAFHELYKRSRMALARFHESQGKFKYYGMPEMTGFNPGNHSYAKPIESQPYEKQPIDMCGIQMETNVGGPTDPLAIPTPTNFVCECHNKTFANSNSYHEHMKLQTRQFVCDICGNILRSRKSLAQHFIKMHQKKLISKPEKEPNLMNDLCVENCRRKCSMNISAEDRLTLFSLYYSLDVNGKNSMLFNCIRRQDVKQHRKNITRTKQHTFTYTIELPNMKGSVEVCKKAFRSIFQISFKKIETIQKKRSAGEIIASEDKRGKHSNRTNKTPDHTVNEIIKHISSFPLANAPYSRKKKYLATVWSVAQMHKMYLEYCAANNLPKNYYVKYGIYSNIFQTKFNLSFKKPQKQK